MKTKTQFLFASPVLPSSDIERDLKWYEEKTGFKPIFGDKMYAGIGRDNIFIHLQWHADTNEDPLLGGSVIRIFIKHIEPLFEEFVERGTINPDKLKLNTPWNTNEFGFYDLNKNALFFVEGL